MAIFRRRARAWLTVPVRVLLLGVPVVALAGDPDVLTLVEAQRLALIEQPALAAAAATVRSLRDESVAAGQLPDPQLIAGVMQLPLEDSEAWSLRDDEFTALSVGVSQEFPRATKRTLRASALEQQAQAGELRLAVVGRQVQLQAGLAFLEVAAAAEGAGLLERLRAEAEKQQAVADIDRSAGRGSQAEQIAAAVETEVLADRGRALRQLEQASRAALARWTGPAIAERPVPAELAALPAPPPLAMLLDQLPGHPQLAEPAARVRSAATEARLAGVALQPDWRLELRYDHRLEFPDLVTLMVGVDLPFFTGNRQDRSSSAARARLAAGTAEQDDHLREATATLISAYRQWWAGAERLARYDDRLLPQSRSRVQSALATYQSGQAPLSTVLEARRSLLEIELMRLDLAFDVARQRLQVQYFETEASQ